MARVVNRINDEPEKIWILKVLNFELAEISSNFQKMQCFTFFTFESLIMKNKNKKKREKKQTKKLKKKKAQFLTVIF